MKVMIQTKDAAVSFGAPPSDDTEDDLATLLVGVLTELIHMGAIYDIAYIAAKLAQMIDDASICTELAEAAKQLRSKGVIYMTTRNDLLDAAYATA